MKSNLVEHNLKKEAKNCNNCLGWLHNCNADCCRVFKMNINLLNEGRDGVMWAKAIPDPEYIWYMRLHGVKMREGKMIFNLKDYKIDVKDDEVYFYRPCNNLKNNLCIGHESGDKPKICKEFNENCGKDNSKWFVVPTCLANYKR